MIKLNIRRFADATQSITLTLRSDSYNPVRYVYFQVDQVGPQTFNWHIWNAKANSSSAAWITAHQFNFWINGQKVWDMSGISGYNSSGDYLGSRYHVFPVTISSEGASGTYTSPNIPDGFNITAKAGYDSSGYVKESTVWFTCAKYNFTSQPSISVDSKDETSIKVKWSTSQTCNEIKWYRGSTLVATTNPNGTSGTYTFTGLTANTQYTLKGNFKRADSGYTMDSNTITPSTDNYPYVTTLNPQSITLGQTLTQTVNISNPHNRQTTVYVKLNNSSGTTIASATTSGTSASIAIPTNDLYQQIPSSPSGTLYYYCVYGNHTTTGITGTYRINGNERPTFPTANWSYVANLTQLTNDNQIVIDGYSDVTITIDTPASSDYYASITSYYAKWGDVTNNNLTPSNPVTLTGGTGTSLIVLANDSRELQSPLGASTLDITSKRVLYTKPVVNVSETHRLNGIDTLVTLNATGTMYKGTFGANGVQNDIASVGYRVKGVGQPDSAYSQLYPISLNNCYFDSSTGQWTISNASIHQNGQSGGFPSGSSYNVKLEFYDAQGLLGFGTYVSTVEDGTIARDVFKGSNGEYHEGINGLADSDYTQTIHGKINVIDGYYLNGTKYTETINVGNEVDDNYRVNFLKSKNLLNLQYGQMFPNASGTVTSNSSYYTVIINTTNMTNVYVSGDFSLLIDGLLRVGKYNSYPVVGSTGTRISMTSSGSINVSDGNYLLLSFAPSGSASTFESDINTSFMINEGTTALPYEPYMTPSIYVDNEEIYSKPDIVELLGGDAIEIGLSARYTTSYTAWTPNIINLNITKQVTGTKLTRSGNKVVIGAGVSKVLVLATGVDFMGGINAGEHDFGILVNGTWYGNLGDPDGGLQTMTCNTMFTVNQGDTIQIGYNYGGSASNCTIYEMSRLIVIALK